MNRLIVLLALFVPGLCAAADHDLQNLIQMLDYVGVDYREAVTDGKIINASEYEEMQDFSVAIAAQIAQLSASPAKTKLLAQAGTIGELIETQASPTRIADLTASVRTAIIRHYDVAFIPRRAPDLESARYLYAQTCAGCHGSQGRGDGFQAAGLEPPPTNFHDRARARHRSPYGLYNTITLGVEGTAMPAFHNLSEHERWSLAFYVGTLAMDAFTIEQGAAVWKQTGDTPLTDLETLATTTPAEAEARYSDEAVALLAYLRAHPAALFEQQAEPLAYTRDRLAQSFALYRDGSARSAYQAAITAYLEGFELVESGLDTVDRNLRVNIEEGMTHYRNLIRRNASTAIVGTQLQSLYALLAEARERLDSASLGGPAVFAASLIILLREGLEALLVVTALAAFLIKTDRRDGMPYLHAGWIGALALGVVTSLAAGYVIKVSGAGRELAEGIAALIAAGVLFYVGFWMHAKTRAQQWQQFIKGSMEKALGRGTLWGLAGLSFIAVFREVFETILFYQALWLQVDAADHGLIVGGMVAALVVLAVIAWLVLRYSVRLPLRQFFGTAGIFMFALAVILAGNGVAALQEAGQLPTNPVPFARIELLGIYPNLQSLLLQLAMVLMALSLIFVVPRLRRAAA
jgi:high-affinity iron transporter